MNFVLIEPSKYFRAAIGLVALFALFVANPALGQTAATAQPQASAPTTAQQETKKPADGEWRTIQPSEANAIFDMPKKPIYKERVFKPVIDQPEIKVRLHLATVNQGKTSFIFGYHDIHETPKDRKTLEKALDGAVRGSVVNVNGQLTSKPTKIRFLTHMGRQFAYLYAQGDKRYVVVARVFIVGRRQYQISCIMLESIFDENLASKFLNSFKLVEPENDEPPVPRIKKQ